MADFKAGSVYIDIQARMGTLETDLKRLESNMKKTSDTASNLKGMLSNVGIGLSVGAAVKGIFDIGKAALKASAEMEQNKIAFTTMLGSADKANALLKDMQKFAATTPFEMTEVVKAGKQLTAFGVAAKDIIPTLTKIGDISAGLNIPIGELADIYGKIKTSNRIMGDDLRQLGGRGIPIVAELAKIYKVTEAEVYKLSETGKIGFKEFDTVFTNLTKSGSKFGGLMEKQSKSLAGQWSNFNDQLEQTLIKMGDEMSPVASTWLTFASNLISLFTKAGGIFDGLPKPLKDVANAIGTILNPLKLMLTVINDAAAGFNKLVDYIDETDKKVAKYQDDVEGGRLKAMEGLKKSEEARKKATDSEISAYKKLLEEAKKFGEEVQKASEQTEDPTVKIQQEIMALDGKQNANEAYRRKGLISETQYNFNLQNINELRIKKELELEKAKRDQIVGYYNSIAGVAGGLASQLSNLVSMSASNQTATIDNATTAQMEAIQTTYDAQVAAIEGETLTTEERNAKLKALDEQKARDEKALQLKADKEKRKIAREAAQTQKALSIFQVLITTPTAAMNAYNALAGIPFVGPALGIAAAAATVAMGAAQIALISEAPLPALAQGGIIPSTPGGTQFIGGEGGNAEAVIPLNDATLGRLAKMINTAGGNGGQPIQVIVNLDGTVIYTDLYKATKDGRAMISQRAVVA